jgi:hypothetical protein
MTTGAMSAAVVLAVLLAGPAFAEPKGQAPAPKASGTSPWARNFEGVWTNATLTSLERPERYKQLVVPKDEADAVEKDANSGAGYNAFWIDNGDGLMRVRGEARSSFITSPADGKMPFRDRAKSHKLMAKDGQEYRSGKGTYEGPEDLPLRERCLIGHADSGGPVMLNALYNTNYSFFVTPGHFVMQLEMINDVRVAPIFASAAQARASHKPAAMAPWLGDSVAWWEGDTLVTETRYVHPVQEARTMTPVSPQGTVTERFTRIAKDELLYQFTVDDPVHYTQAWSGEYSFKPSKGQIYEYACHEGNYSMEGILRGARMDEAAARGGGN